MGILFITWNFPPRRGGIECLMQQLSAELSKRHPVWVITAHAADMPSCQNNVFRSPWPGLVPFGLYALWQGAMVLSRKPDIGVVFGGSALVTPVVFLLARLFRRKAVVQVHGLDLVYRSLWYQILCARWLKYCDQTIANSQYTASLAAARGVSRVSISVIPLGVDTTRFVPGADCEILKRERGLGRKSVILFVGRLARRKGVKEFIQNSLPLITRKVPQAFFVVAGGNPTQSLAHRDDVQTEIQNAVRELGLQNSVRLMGEVSDDELLKLYQCCEVVVLPALSSAEDVEGFGLVLLEAAAVGKPVIATNVGGIPDAVVAEKSGRLIKPGDYRKLSESIIELLADATRRQSMGEFARNRVQREFAWSVVASQYENNFVG